MPNVPNIDYKEIFYRQTGRKPNEIKTVIVCGPVKTPTIAGNLNSK